MAGVIDNYFGIHARALQVSSKRAELLAANIAHADTPYYKARDIDFRSVLSSAKASGSVQLAKTDKRHIGPDSEDIPQAQVKYRVPLQPSLDGNTVESQVEHGLFAENAIRHQASLQFLGNKINGLIRTLREE